MITACMLNCTANLIYDETAHFYTPKYLTLVKNDSSHLRINVLISLNGRNNDVVSSLRSLMGVKGLFYSKRSYCILHCTFDV